MAELLLAMALLSTNYNSEFLSVHVYELGSTRVLNVGTSFNVGQSTVVLGYSSQKGGRALVRDELGDTTLKMGGWIDW